MCSTAANSPSGCWRYFVAFTLFIAILYALLAVLARKQKSTERPIPVAPPPGPSAPPSKYPGMTAINLINNEFNDGVIFCRGPVEGSMDQIFLDADMRHPVIGSYYDSSKPDSLAAQRFGAGVPGGCTLAFGLARGASTTIYIAAEGTWPSGACWFQDYESNSQVSLAPGPRYMSQVEFTIDKSGEGSVWYDMSSVEGVSGGLTMNYTDDFGKVQTDVAIPGKFSGPKLRVEPAPGIGFPTVLSDKNTLNSCFCDEWSPDSEICNTDACYAGCPGALVDNPCGQHRCRVFYALQYQDPESYCGWLYSQNAQSYCWAMDEWRCMDTTCGYGGMDQPAVDCSSQMPADASANTYSCGHGGNLDSNISGVQWWTLGAGCEDKLVNGVPTNPAPARHGGRIDISFEGLPWLHEESHQGGLGWFGLRKL